MKFEHNIIFETEEFQDNCIEDLSAAHDGDDFCTLNQNVGSSEIFNCNKCKLICGRDDNAAKNIFLKGILL
jgi:hypothetical protein